MHTLGHSFVPAGIHAGGLRYHGDAPMLCHAVNLGLIEAQAVHQIEAFEAGVLFARTEGHVPAPETNHAIAVAIREANKCKETGQEKVIAFNYSGHGFFDLSAYERYFAGELEDFEYPAEAIKKALAELPIVPMG